MRSFTLLCDFAGACDVIKRHACMTRTTLFSVSIVLRRCISVTITILRCRGEEEDSAVLHLNALAIPRSQHCEL